MAKKKAVKKKKAIKRASKKVTKSVKAKRALKKKPASKTKQYAPSVAAQDALEFDNAYEDTHEPVQDDTPYMEPTDVGTTSEGF